MRWNEHVKAYKGQQRAYVLHRAMRKYGLDAFTIELLHEYPSEEAAAHAEIECIANLDLTRTGYNASRGGDISPTLGIGHSDETKRKLSAAAKVQFADPIQLDLMRERSRRQMQDPVMRANARATLSFYRDDPEVRAKAARGRIGLKRSLETRAKMAEARRKYWARRREQEMRV